MGHYIIILLLLLLFVSQEKPLRISGDPAKVEIAKQLVFELLADKDMGGGGPRPSFDNFQGSDDGNLGSSNSTEVLIQEKLHY